MSQYAKKTPLAAWMDKLLLRLAILAAGVGWFIFLWGVSLPALMAGLAYGTLLLTCLERFLRLTVRQREERIRRRVGGEIALDALLTQDVQHASFQAALWLDAPIELQRSTAVGVLGKLEGQSVLIQAVNLHPTATVDVQRLIEARREAMRQKVDASILCLTSPLSRDAEAYAETGTPRLKIVPRDKLLRLAGACSPATDEQLRALGGQRRKHVGAKRWLRHILAPKRAKRYFAYGVGLALLYFITGLPYYPLPALICLTLCILCKLYHPKEGSSYLGDHA